MFLFSVQTILLIAAGVGLFWLWRAAVPSERWLTLAVAAGFLARAIFGQALFWISWARLPMARSLQLGDGFWVFAQDARWYVSEATRVAHTGPWAIVMYDRGAASVMYEQLLATFIWLFGSAVSVALLINLFSYLGTVAILVQWSRRQPRTATATALAIVAIAFSPAFVLWALQPLKDPFFQFLFVAFVAACAAWQRAWVGPGRWAARLGTAALLVALIFALAGIRWYFAAVLVAAASLFMLLVVFQSAERRLVSLGAAVVVALLLSWSLAISAAPYLSGRLRAFLNPRTTLQTMKTAPASILGSVEQARKGFDQTAASTVIRTGDRLKTKSAPAPAVQVVNVVTERPKPQPRPQAKPQPKPAAPPAAPQPKAVALAEQPAATPLAVAPPAPTPVADLAPPKATLKVLSESELPAADAADVRAVLEAEVAAWNRRDMQNFVSWWWMSPKFELQHGDTVVHGPEKVTEYLSKTYGNKDSPGQVAMADLRMTGTPGDTALVRGTWTVTVP
ncbi:MAG TPA: hypothetical protein VEO74_09730, partial [Thermoanaerobaculia bacterium]|nr:hypothetical protein [Thermoanaerobaculia bacterium]